MNTIPNYVKHKGRHHYRKISRDLKLMVEGEIKALLHASRDTLRNLDKDTASITFSASDGYYGEAFGVMRTLAIQRYGYFGSSNLNALKEDRGGTQPEHNLRWWICQLEHEVLEEEGYYNKTHVCLYCREHYHKDTAIQKKRKALGVPA